MKKLIAAIFIASTVLAQAPWQDPGLKIEYALSHNNSTSIFYRDYTSTTNNNDLVFENKLYRKNINSGEETLLFSSKTVYSGTNLLSKVDAEFLSFSSEHPDSFYIAGQISSDSTGAFVKGKEINVFHPNKIIEFFFASKQTPGKFYVKIDGAYKVSYDYCKTFQILHQVERFICISPFNDNEVIAWNSGGIVRSIDGGINYTALYQPTWSYDSVSVSYTRDSSFLLLTSRSIYDWMNEIKYSTQAGSAGTFNSALNNFFGTMHVIPYKSPSDSIYFYRADTLFSKKLGAPVLSGQKVSNIFDTRITGSSAITGSTDLFISTTNKIFKKTGNVYEEVKWITTPLPEPDFYPLHIGDFWVYKVTGWWADTFWYPIDYTTVTRVMRDTLVPGWGKFFVSDRFNSNPYFPKLEMKKDNGKIYELIRWGSDTTHNILLTEDNSLREGDVSDMSVLGSGNIYCRVSDISYKEHFGKMRATRELEIYSLYWYLVRSVDGVGIVEARSSFDFGEEIFKLTGAYVNGVVYGDTTTTAIEVEEQTPQTFKVSQNFPNPFNGSTKISFSLPASGEVVVRIFNILGQEVMRINPGNLPAGKNEVSLTMPAQFNSGVYLCRLEFGDKAETRKIIYLK